MRIRIVHDYIAPSRLICFSIVRRYQNKEHIACSGHCNFPFEYFKAPCHLCAFLQDTEGKYGREIKKLTHHILDHGCKRCGSVPTSWVDGAWNGNDVTKGQLTFNMVRNFGANAPADN